MGIFSFAKDIGDKIFNRNKKDAAPAANTAAPAEPTAQEIANLLLARVQAQNVQISNLSVNYNSDTDTVTLSGAAKTQEDRERARLAVGNVQHVESVVDNITVESQEPESRFYTVKSGDTLSKISKEFYGDANQYNKIFEANKPLLKDVNKIYPGQTLRIPE